MSADAGEALEVLRQIWQGTGQRSADLDDADSKTCKKMQDVGFGDFAAGGANLKAAWRARLEREGKLGGSAGSVRDLVIGSPKTSG